jgi:transcription elongation factor Elf1
MNRNEEHKCSICGQKMEPGENATHEKDARICDNCICYHNLRHGADPAFVNTFYDWLDARHAITAEQYRQLPESWQSILQSNFIKDNKKK